VRVANDRGAFELEAVVEPLSRAGVCVTFKTHWPKLVGGANANVTTPERDADMGGAPTFHDNRVEVTRS
jgi:anaerobic selenocysteine-containing dehydrogenase